MKPLLFLDVETSTPVPEKPEWSLDPRRNKIDLIGFTPALPDIGAESPTILTPDQASKGMFADQQFCGHGFKFDYRTLHHKGFKLSIEQYRHDTLIMATACMTKVPDEYIEGYEKKRRELNASLPKGQTYRPAKKHSLKVLAPYFLGINAFWENPATTNDLEYLKKDVEYTRGLFEHFVPMLKKDGVWSFYEERLMAWQKMTLQAEIDGIHVNREAMQELKEQAEAGVLSSMARLREAWKKVEEEWQRKCETETRGQYSLMLDTALSKVKPGKTDIDTLAKKTKTVNRYEEMAKKALTKLEPFNYASPAQILWAFKEVLGYPTVNIEGDETTGADMLSLLAASGKDDIKALLEYRENYKLAHSYFPSYEELIVDGRINCSFNIHGTRTGRLSCSDPNMQQVPPILKKIFCPAPGNSFVSQDLSAIEPVLIAYVTEDENLCRILIDGEDFHGVAAVQFELVNCRANEVKAKEPLVRYAAKQGDLSIFYGSGKRRLFTTLTLNGIKAVKGQPLSEQICASMVRRFREYFKESWQFKEMLDAELLAGNYVENMFGRRFKIENPEDVYIKGFNRFIQGAASDMLLEGTLDLLKELEQQGIWCRLRLLVHDNSVLECKDNDAEYVNSRLIHHLTKFKLNTRHGLVPLKTEGSYGKTWKS